MFSFYPESRLIQKLEIYIYNTCADLVWTRNWNMSDIIALYVVISFCRPALVRMSFKPAVQFYSHRIATFKTKWDIFPSHKTSYNICIEPSEHTQDVVFHRCWISIEVLEGLHDIVTDCYGYMVYPPQMMSTWGDCTGISRWHVCLYGNLALFTFRFQQNCSVAFIQKNMSIILRCYVSAICLLAYLTFLRRRYE